MKTKSLVLFSAGLDSSFSLVKASLETNLRFALLFDYGHKSARQEIEASQKICAHYGVDLRVLPLKIYSHLQKHPFFNPEVSMPSPNLSDIENTPPEKRTGPSVWVPNRNGFLVNAAACIAEMEDIAEIYVGFNKEEAVSGADNSPEFVEALNLSLSFSTKNKVKIKSPPLAMIKSEIVAELAKLKFPFELLWSCFDNKGKMCGNCSSCKRLKRAFQANEILEQNQALFQNHESV